MKNWKFVQVGNSQKEFKSIEEMEQWCKQNGYSYEETSRGYYRLSNGSKFLQAHVASKVENKDTPELREKLRDLTEQIKNWEHARSIDGVDETKVQKTLDQLRKERSKVQTEIATGNESIDEQEWSMFKGLKDDAEKEVGNAFDFETQAVVDRKEAVKTAEENLRKAESERNKHRGEQFFEEAYITAKKDLERAKENLERAKRQKTGNKKVGNAISDYSVITTKDGYFVYKKGQKVGGPFQNEEQAKAFAAQLQTKDPQWANKVGNDLPMDAEVKYNGYIIRYYPYQGKYIVTHPTDFSKTNAFIGKKFSTSEEAIKAIEKRGVGNESASQEIRNEYNAEIHRLEKKMEELYRRGQGHSAMHVQKQIEQLQKELRELGNKKTGNNLQRARNAIKK